MYKELSRGHTCCEQPLRFGTHEEMGSSAPGRGGQRVPRPGSRG